MLYLTYPINFEIFVRVFIFTLYIKRDLLWSPLSSFPDWPLSLNFFQFNIIVFTFFSITIVIVQCYHFMPRYMYMDVKLGQKHARNEIQVRYLGVVLVLHKKEEM